MESIGFPTDSVTAASSYKKAPGFEREDLVGAEYLKNFKCQVGGEYREKGPKGFILALKPTAQTTAICW